MTRTIVGDLHTHSTASDGDLSPAEVVREAHALGLKAVALTDHDTLAGLDEALHTGREVGQCVICGVEVSLRFRRSAFVGSLHYILYFPSSLLSCPDFTGTLSSILAKGRGHRLTAERVATINVLFGPEGSLERVLPRPLTTEAIEAASPNPTRRHFAEVLTRQYGLERASVSRLISNDSPAYVPSGIEMGELRPLFERFSTARVLAHPAAGSCPEPSVYREVLPPFETVERMIPEFLAFGLDGLEVYYPGHTPEHTRLLESCAREHSLLVTGGSDAHDRIERPLGTAGVTEAELGSLLAVLRS